ncbi:SulP family inorganic anion transporter [bacterium]|nr:SulP family inorganic anion transporter [bacterium]
MFSNGDLRLKNNLISGLTVFLIALPLSIGISVASGAPPTAGLLSAIIGGIVASLISGSQVTISGPAAGLIVVVLECINSLGQGDPIRGFKLTLAATVIAGALQILMGLSKLGSIGLAVPINALHGMMASIGVTIITKQLYVLGGIKPQSKALIGQIAELPGRMVDDNFVILGIGLVCLGIVWGLNQVASIRKIVPPALVAVVIGYVLSLALDIEHSHFVNVLNHEYPVGPEYLISIPLQFSGYFYSPLFEGLTSGHFIQAVITIALVASIESLLSTYAIDKLDPLKRTSNLNMDLISKGTSNILLGFIGGLPIISEIVRSTANVTSGATNRLSNIFHGVFILIFVLLFPALLNHIPLTTFAAILIFVGFRLANPLQLIGIYKSGKSQVLIFLVTILTTLSTDLLIGVFTGVVLELLINLWKVKNPQHLFKVKTEIKEMANETVMHIQNSCVFTNMLFLKKEIEKTTSKILVLDFAPNVFVDATTKELLHNLEKKLLNENRVLLFKNIKMSAASHSH